MRVVVFGASGVQGAHQVPVLARAGHAVVAVSRSPKPLEIDGKEVEIASANFYDKDAIVKVLQNAEIVFLNLPSTSFNQSEPIIAGTKAIGEAAKEAGVRLIVFNTSMPLPDTPQNIKAQDDRREMRRLLRETGVPVISIQPVVYLDNLLEGWALPPIRDRNTVYLGSAITMSRNFAVGGPETVRLEELTEKLSRAWGRKLDYECQTVADFCDKISKTMQGRGLETDRIVSQMFKAYTYYNEAADEPFKIDMAPVLKELPVQLTSIEEWAQRRSPAGW